MAQRWSGEILGRPTYNTVTGPAAASSRNAAESAQLREPRSLSVVAEQAGAVVLVEVQIGDDVDRHGWREGSIAPALERSWP
jgi:hypothetical protein